MWRLPIVFVCRLSRNRTEHVASAWKYLYISYQSSSRFTQTHFARTIWHSTVRSLGTLATSSAHIPTYVHMLLHRNAAGDWKCAVIFHSFACSRPIALQLFFHPSLTGHPAFVFDVVCLFCFVLLIFILTCCFLFLLCCFSLFFIVLFWYYSGIWFAYLQTFIIYINLHTYTHMYILFVILLLFYGKT